MHTSSLVMRTEISKSFNLDFKRKPSVFHPNLVCVGLSAVLQHIHGECNEGRREEITEAAQGQHCLCNPKLCSVPTGSVGLLLLLGSEQGVFTAAKDNRGSLPAPQLLHHALLRHCLGVKAALWILPLCSSTFEQFFSVGWLQALNI